MILLFIIDKVADLHYKTFFYHFFKHMLRICQDLG
jgi:hypothetical protein